MPVIKQRIVWIGGTVIAGAMLWWIAARPTAILVEVARVDRGPVRVTVEEAATTRVRDHVVISATVAGRWVPAPLQVGDPLRAGARVGMLYPAPLDAAAQEQARARFGAADATVREAESHVIAARRALEDAERTATRTAALARAGGLSDEALEQAQAAVVTRRSELAAADARVRSALYERTTAQAVVTPLTGSAGGLRITTPVAGTVLQRAEEHERVVAPGTPLLTIGDPRALEIVIPVLTSVAPQIHVGAPVQLVLGTDTIDGTVRRTEPAAFMKVSALGVDEQRVNVIATAPTLHAGDQYGVTARIRTGQADQVIRVATGALVHTGTDWMVFRVEGTQARRVAVVPGLQGDGVTEIRQGLSPGDLVVVYPGDQLRDGTRIRVPAR